jgi:hypothetical protein
METGDPEVDLIREGVLTIRGGVIESVGALGTLIPSGATNFNAQGGIFYSNLECPSADHLIQDT